MRAILLSALVLIAGTARAQTQCGRGGPQTPAGIPGSIVGLVTDDTNSPLEGITIVMANPKRQARTNARGEFRIDSVPQGTFPIVVRRIGFEPGLADIEVREKGGIARICMAEETVGLDPMITSIFRGGLSGVVADSTYKPLFDVEVRANATNKWAYTDSTGSFFIDLKPGSYAVIVHKKGFARQIVSVTIPADSGRQIAVWLNKADGYENRRAEAIDGMRWRGVMSPKTRYAVMTREDLAKTSMNIEQAVRIKGIGSIAEDCDVGVMGPDGIGYPAPLWSISKDEIELLEIMGDSPFSKRGQTSMLSRPAMSQPGLKPNKSAPGCEVHLMVWLRGR
jgi:hypothetical protein